MYGLNPIPDSIHHINHYYVYNILKYVTNHKRKNNVFDSLARVVSDNLNIGPRSLPKKVCSFFFPVTNTSSCVRAQVSSLTAQCQNKKGIAMEYIINNLKLFVNGTITPTKNSITCMIYIKLIPIITYIKKYDQYFNNEFSVWF